MGHFLARTDYAIEVEEMSFILFNPTNSHHPNGLEYPVIFLFPDFILIFDHKANT